MGIEERVAERVAANALLDATLRQSDEPTVASGWGTDLRRLLERGSTIHGDGFLVVTDRRVVVLPIELVRRMARGTGTVEALNAGAPPFSVRRDLVASSRHKRRGFGHVAEFVLGNETVSLSADRTLVAAMLRITKGRGPVSDATVLPVLSPAGSATPDLSAGTRPRGLGPADNSGRGARCGRCGTPFPGPVPYCPGCARDVDWTAPEAVAVRDALRR